MGHSRGLVRGAAAGAAGTTALNAATYLDMVIRGRGASDTPEQLVVTLADRVGTDVPGRGGARGNRVSALGALSALSGLATGVALGSLAGGLRSAGVRLPTVVGGPLLGLAAMLATDLPVALLGVADPRRWTTSGWLSDAAPHLVYGLATHAGLVAGERSGGTPDPEQAAARRSALGRAVALGAATGGRSSAGVVAVAVTTRAEQVPGPGAALVGSTGTAITTVLAVVELVLDKLPQTPSRVAPQGMAPRVLLGGVSAAVLAQRESGDPVLGVVVGGAAAAAAARLGLAWRGWAAGRFGSDRPGALTEDAVVAGLGWLGARRR